MTRFLGGGAEVPVDVETLVDAIYVSPDAPEWFASLVRSVVDRLGFQMPVRQSGLARDPVF